jgi:hypothetical protein
MARSRTLAVVITAALTLTFLAACGNTSSASNSPQAVQSALHNTANQSGLQLTLSLQGDPSAFSDNGSSTLTLAQKQAILASKLVLTVNAAKGTKLVNAGTGGELAFALTHGVDTILEVREVDTKLYARVDLDKLTRVYGLDTGTVAHFRTQLGNLGKQVQGLQALDKGRWVSVDVSQLDSIAALANVTLPSLPQLVARIVGAFFSGLAQSNHIQPTKARQAQITVNTQQLVTTLAQAVASTPGMSSLNKQTNNLAQRARKSVPANKSAVATVTVGAGIVSNLELGLSQFDTSHQMSDTATANLAVAKSGPVSAPSGSEPINLPQLIRALEGSPASS